MICMGGLGLVDNNYNCAWIYTSQNLVDWSEPKNLRLRRQFPLRRCRVGSVLKAVGSGVVGSKCHTHNPMLYVAWWAYSYLL
jgi:hypothetical protein